MTGKARFEQTAGNKPPILSPGDVSPEELHKWETGCRQYFKVKTIAVEYQVTHVAWNLQDLRVQDWYTMEANRLNTLTFDDFMKEVRKTWLPVGLGHNNPPKDAWIFQQAKSFRKWTIEVQSLNTDLTQYAVYLDDCCASVSTWRHTCILTFRKSAAW
ncbi:hypothetical protein J3R83DRAFT_5635 [Lanmaoa asiatica]|nr:hypothetical protein J3R83DRAFT_5635 [Lanmaoa asiatica]